MMTSPFFDAQVKPTRLDVLEVNGCKVQLNLPPALKSKVFAGQEEEQSLPPYERTPGFSVDTLNAPKEWERSRGNLGSFVFGVKPNTGLWLDFNGNADNSHDIAVLISVQGINALTGKKTDSFTLEQYPGGKPPQNYLCSNGAPRGGFWLDGFAAADGVVRQWVFTEDEKRGVAKHIIGNEAVQALGLAFYKSRQPKPRPPVYRGGYRSLGETTLSAASATRGVAKSVEVAAGARIKQRVDRDPESLNYWESSPCAIMVIYYVTEEDLAGMIPPTARQEDGFMTGMPTGN